LVEWRLAGIYRPITDCSCRRVTPSCTASPLGPRARQRSAQRWTKSHSDGWGISPPPWGVCIRALG